MLLRELFKSASLSFLSHATEDEERLLDTVAKFFQIDKDLFKGKKLEGYFGNPIIKFDAQIKGELANKIALKIIKGLSEFDKLYLSKHIKEFVDEHGDLYLRISKQEIFEGKVKLEQSDPIRIKLKFMKGSRFKKEAVKAYLDLINEI